MRASRPHPPVRPSGQPGLIVERDRESPAIGVIVFPSAANPRNHLPKVPTGGLRPAQPVPHRCGTYEEEASLPGVRVFADQGEISKEFPFYCNFASSRPDHIGDECSEREREQPGQDVARLFHIVGSTVPVSYFDPERRQPKCAADSQSRVSTCLMFWNRS